MYINKTGSWVCVSLCPCLSGFPNPERTVRKDISAHVSPGPGQTPGCAPSMIQSTADKLSLPFIREDSFLVNVSRSALGLCQGDSLALKLSLHVAHHLMAMRQDPRVSWISECRTEDWVSLYPVPKEGQFRCSPENAVSALCLRVQRNHANTWYLLHATLKQVPNLQVTKVVICKSKFCYQPNQYMSGQHSKLP